MSEFRQHDKIKVHPAKVRGIEFAVWVDADGRFWAVGPDGEAWVEYSPTREALETRLLSKTRVAAAKVAVPFTRWYGEHGKDGVATGIHGGNGNLITSISGQDTRSYGYENLQPLEPEQVTELAGLFAAFQEARDAYNSRIEELKIRPGLKELVSEAVAEAAREAQG